MNIQNNVKERFYFSYIKSEQDYLKSKGFQYLTKGIHPRTGVLFLMFDKTKKIKDALNEYITNKQ